MFYRECFQHLYKVKRVRIPPTPAGDLRLHRLERPEPWERWPATNFYPDYAAFYRRLAEFIGFPAENFVAGNGIEDLIRSLVMLSCDPGDGLAYTAPTCAMFGLYAEIFGARKVEIATSPDHLLTTRDVCRAMSKGVKLLILPNPGQPVDSCFSLDELRSIARHCRDVGAILAVDEAYHGFGAPTALPLVAEFENLVVLRTFSKAFGAAALRVGFAVGQFTAIQPLEASRPSGELSGPAMATAVAMMNSYQATILPGVAKVIEGRDWLRDQLTEDGFKARGSFANHVLVKVPGGGFETAQALRDRHVHVRGSFAAPLDQHILVTAGPLPLMKRFYSVFEALHG